MSAMTMTALMSDLCPPPPDHAATALKMFTRYSPPPTVKTSSIGLPPRLVQTLCVEAARKVQRGRHTGRHGILERRFQHNASVDDLQDRKSTRLNSSH